MKFSGLTKKGKEYLAKIQAAGIPIQFTKIKFGDGNLEEHENPADLIDIKNIKVENSILEKEQKEDAVVLTTLIDNVSLEEGYFPRETGIYVLDDDSEVLYFYMNDGNETSWIPPEIDGPHKMEVKINLLASNTGAVIVHNDGKDLYITKDYLDTELSKKENAFSKNTAFNKNFGTTSGTALEGSKYETMTGTNYGGSLNDAGIKEEGKTYWDNNTKALYLCKNNNSDTSANTRNFEPLDNKSLLKLIRNFPTLKKEVIENDKVRLTLYSYSNDMLFGNIEVLKQFRIGGDGILLENTLKKAYSGKINVEFKGLHEGRTIVDSSTITIDKNNVYSSLRNYEVYN